MHPDPCLTALAPSAFDSLVQRLTHATRRRHGRPWSLALPARIHIACIYLRTNLTARELAAVCSISKSQVHRILSDLVPRTPHDSSHPRRRLGTGRGSSTE